MPMRHRRWLPVGPAIDVATSIVGEVVDATRVTIGVQLAGPTVAAATPFVREDVDATCVTVEGCPSVQQSVSRQRP